MNITEAFALIAQRLPNTEIRWSPRSPADGAGDPAGFPGWETYRLIGQRAVGTGGFVEVSYEVRVKDRGLPTEEVRARGLPLEPPAPETSQQRLDRLLAEQVQSLVTAGTVTHAAPFDEVPYSLTRRVNVRWNDGTDRIYLASLDGNQDLVFTRIDV